MVPHVQLVLRLELGRMGVSRPDAFMFRPIVVILSIVNLVLCPLACTGVLRCAERDGSIQKPACHCGMCEQSRDVPRDRLPPVDQSSDSCQCVCGGAVSLKDSGPDFAPVVAFWVAASLVDDTISANAPVCSAAETIGSRPDSCSGRALRLELASLLC